MTPLTRFSRVTDCNCKSIRVWGSNMTSAFCTYTHQTNPHFASTRGIRKTHLTVFAEKVVQVFHVDHLGQTAHMQVITLVLDVRSFRGATRVESVPGRSTSIERDLPATVAVAVPIPRGTPATIPPRRSTSIATRGSVTVATVIVACRSRVLPHWIMGLASVD